MRRLLLLRMVRVCGLRRDCEGGVFVVSGEVLVDVVGARHVSRGAVEDAAVDAEPLVVAGVGPVVGVGGAVRRVREGVVDAGDGAWDAYEGAHDGVVLSDEDVEGV